MAARVGRALLLLLGVLLLLVGLLQLATGWGGVGPVLFGCAAILGVFVERWRYKRVEVAEPPSRFQPTAERFLDPTSRQPVRVYADPATGERCYVRDGAGP